MVINMKSTKMILRSMLVFVVIICMTACGGNKETSSDKNDVSETGVWSISDQKIEDFLPDEVEKAFNKATEALAGCSLEPLAYVGSQVVAGMNYMILCRATTSAKDQGTSYKMAVIYADLEGNAELLSLKDFDLSEFTDGDGTSITDADKAADMDIVGGWSIPEDAAGAGLPKDINEKYESATASVDWIWSKVSPLAYLGSQVVAGNNYALICKGESSSEERADSMMIVTIYEDPDGKSELSNIHLLDLADFTDQ
jgi:hypothetical protein